MQEDDIVAIGGELNTETLLMAYRNGVFPWPDPDFEPVIWACPVNRGVLFFDELHIPRKLAKAHRTHPYSITIDRDFARVIEECSKSARPGQTGTWITPAMQAAYRELHALGAAHSVEVWRGTELVGGLYGVSVDGTFSGESMFYKEENASKLALLFLIERLRERGCEWIDIQQLTPHMEALGARAIPRKSFLELLLRTQKRNLKLF